MNKISLKSIIDSNSLLTISGDYFYQKLLEPIAKDEHVIVDMSEVSSLPSVFLNVSIGRIIDNYGLDRLKRNMSFTSITRQQAKRLSDYIAKYSVEKTLA